MNENEKVTAAVTRRYKDAYLHARTIVDFGATIKILAAVLGAIIAIGGLSGGNTTFLLLGVVSAATIGIVVYFFGVTVAAQGQILDCFSLSAKGALQMIKSPNLCKG